MKYPRAAICAMAAVHVLIYILVACFSSFGALIDSGIVLGQGCLVGLWTALGGKPSPWRVMFVIIAAVGWEWYASLAANDAMQQIRSITMLLIGQTFQVMGVLLLARFLGSRLERVEHATEVRREHLQFSIGEAILWMSTFALFMGATHYLKDVFRYYYGPFSKPYWCQYALYELVVALLATWLALGNKWTVARWLVLLTVIGVGMAGLHQIIPLLPRSSSALRHPQEYETVYASELMLTAASCLVVRLAGYRLTWHWPFRRAELEM